MEEFCPVKLLAYNCESAVADNKLPKSELSAQDLIDFGGACASFRLKLCSSSSSPHSPENLPNNSNASNFAPLDEDENCFAELDFRENRDLLGDKLQTAQFSNNCQHFEAVNSDLEHSALSICSKSNIAGIFRLNGKLLNFGHFNDRFGIIPQGQSSSLHSCDILFKGHRSKWLRRRKARSVAEFRGEGGAPPRLPDYYRDYLDGVRRYVELVFVADNSIYNKYDKDAAKIHERLQSIAGIVNSLYAPLNIRITLVWADIWTNADHVEVNTQADRTLARFMTYRKSELLAEHPHDNAHLITDVRFGEVIGKAYRGTMCSYDYSGGVIVDHSPHVTFVGGTVAHEMGHNFGMDHDSGYPEPCKCTSHQCIMAPSSSTVNATTYFSDCSLEALEKALKRGVDYCLQNVPEEAFGGAKCGNGVLEAGEECDCGSTKLCPNRCCVAATCRLAPEAQCADGDCCDPGTCKPRSPAKVCRASTNSCDLPEFCDGRNPVCPPDFFVQNGHTCPDDEESFCYDGVCGSRDQQCRLIWGPTGQNSAPQCYAYNKFGSFSGNCGYDQNTNQYFPCPDEDVQCGRLQCRHLAEKPLFGDPSTVFSAYNFVRLSDGREAACRSVRTTYTGSGRRKHDPGMVPDGAKCGDGKMCVDTKCRNHSTVTQMVTRCEPEDCNGKGICNNVGNCHCVAGYGGPGCDIPGFGGSLNSGPATDEMFNPGLVLAYLLLVGLVAFVLASYYCKRHKDFWLHKKIWRTVKDTLNIRTAVRVPVRRAPPIPGVAIHHTHRFSFNALWGDSSPSPRQQKAANSTAAAPGAALAVEKALRVDASRALATRNSSAALLNGGAVNFAPSPSFTSSTASPTSYYHEPLSHRNHQTVATVAPMPKGHIWENPLRINNGDAYPLVNAVTRDATSISPCASSSSSEAAETVVQKPLQNSISNRQLMEEIKRGIEHGSPLRSVGTKVPVSPTNTSKFSKHTAAHDSVGGGSGAPPPPPPPPHRSKRQNAAANEAENARTGQRPKPPQKPKMAVRPNTVRNTMADGGAQSAAVNATDEDAEKPLSVRQLTAKFGSPKK